MTIFGAALFYRKTDLINYLFESWLIENVDIEKGDPLQYLHYIRSQT